MARCRRRSCRSPGLAAGSARPSANEGRSVPAPVRSIKASKSIRACSTRGRDPGPARRRIVSACCTCTSASTDRFPVRRQVTCAIAGATIPGRLFLSASGQVMPGHLRTEHHFRDSTTRVLCSAEILLARLAALYRARGQPLRSSGWAGLCQACRLGKPRRTIPHPTPPDQFAEHWKQR
jgi:hypothetical protein